MLPIANSPFLHALGFALVNSFWQFALLWLLYFSINKAFKITSHHKYFLGLVLQFAGFTLFIGTIIFCYRQYSITDLSNLPLSQYVLPTVSANYSSPSLSNFAAWLIQTESLLPYLSVMYILLLAFLSVKWLKAYRYTQLIRTSGLQKTDVRWRLFVKRIAMQLGIKNTVTIYLSELVKTPLTIGFLKPVILIPLGGINNLTTEQMEAVILHELAHIKRNDYLFNLCLALVEVTLFFNPFMHLISRHIKNERENCCDDWVLQYEYNATSYAQALLQIASFQFRQPLLALKAAEDKYVLLNRIKRMIEKKERSFFNYRHQVVAMLVIAVVISSLGLLSAGNSRLKINVASHPSSSFSSSSKLGIISLLSDHSVQAFDFGKDESFSKQNENALADLQTKRILNSKDRQANSSFHQQYTLGFSASSPEADNSAATEVSDDAEVENDNGQYDANEPAAPVTIPETATDFSNTDWLRSVNMNNVNGEQVKAELKAILEQLKAMKLNDGLKNSINENPAAEELINNINNQQQARENFILSKEQARLLFLQLKKSIDELKQNYLLLSGKDMNVNLNFKAPEIAFPVPGFSYEFSPKAGSNTKVETRSYTRRKAVEKSTKVEITGEEDQLNEPPVPVLPDFQPGKPVTVRGSVRIIRI